MLNHEVSKEFYSCEKLIVEFKEFFYKNYGLQRVMDKKSGFWRMKLIILPLSRLRNIGFLLIYLLVIYKNRKHGIVLFRDKILLKDHSNSLIQKKILSDYNRNDINYITNKELRCPLKEFFGLSNLKAVLKSYHRVRPKSPTAVYALCELWIYYIVYRYFIPGMDLSGVLVIDDLSERSYALVLAAKNAGLRVGIVALTDETNRVCPFKEYEVLFCWNHAQALEVKNTFKIVSHLSRLCRPIRQLKVSNDQKYTVGIALKSQTLFDEKGLIKLIKNLNDREWVKEIVVRFHPGTKPIDYFADNEKIVYKVSTGKPEVFFKDIDIMVSGSTSLIKDALLAGVPVAYDATLDATVEKDSYSYVSKGMIYNLEKGIHKKEVLKEINDFYQSIKWKDMRDRWVSPDPLAVPVNEALDLLLQ